MKKLTVSARGDLSFQDFHGLQGVMSGGVKAGETRSYVMSNEQWNEIRSAITTMSQQRVELIESNLRTGRYCP